MIKQLLLLPALAAVAGCAALPDKPVFLTGGWGGPGIEILIEGGLATVQFDCASGSIDSNLSAAGSFSVPGSYRAGQGGPIRVGQIFTSQRATYAGTVTGDQMTIGVQVEGGPALGPYTLTRGAPGQLNRCL
ncbi:MAG TPA: hypothetical protein VFK50_01890 [Sphingomicrobium sp.]|nr:hypothetical protein [Sphingomicrobium sp.]